jgi:hypothetical protein
VDLPNVSAGAHRLSLSHGADRHTVDIEAGSAPALMAFLVSDQDIGTLLIVTGEDKVQIYLNNQLQNRTTQGGQLRIPNLTPKDYVVRPVKDGFQSIPPQQVATLRRGEQPRLTFKLELIPHLSSLAVVGGSAGTEVFLDGTSAGTIQPDGTFQLATVSPGDHGIELRKAGFVHKMLQRHFTAGSPVTLNRSDLTLEPVTSQLKVIFSPADALVTLTKTGGSPTKLISGGNLSLEPGKYQLTARVGNFSRSAPVELVGGESRTVGPLSLAPGGIQDFDNPATWKPNKEWFVRRGGGFTLYKTSPTSGTFVFSAMLQKGHRLQWVFNYTDDNNYDLFQIDENFFYRSEVRNGQTSEGAKVAFQTEKKKPRTLQITVTPNRIVHQIQQGDAWANLDSWSQPGVNLSSGKFGFYLPGNDEIALSNFSHYADLNIR